MSNIDHQLEIMRHILEDNKDLLATLADNSAPDAQPMAEQLGQMIIRDYDAGDENLKRYFDSKRKIQRSS